MAVRTRLPLTKVPFDEPRSSSRSWSDERSMRACTFETALTSSRHLQATERPMVSSPVAISCVAPSGSAAAARTMPGGLGASAACAGRTRGRPAASPITSRCCRRSRATRSPLRKVPFVLLRSSIHHPLPSHRMRACSRETPSSGMATPANRHGRAPRRRRRPRSGGLARRKRARTSACSGGRRARRCGGRGGRAAFAAAASPSAGRRRGLLRSGGR